MIDYIQKSGGGVLNKREIEAACKAYPCRQLNGSPERGQTLERSKTQSFFYTFVIIKTQTLAKNFRHKICKVL